VTQPTRPRWLVLTALVLVAANLRIVLASVPAVETEIASATGWSSAAIGSLTMLPVLCMGAFALIVPRLARRIGRRHTVALALALITGALAIRLAALVPGVLHLSALVAGIGIALAAGLVPSIVREQLPRAVGVATGMWTAAMMIGAMAGGALTAPLAQLTGSWQVALASWALPAALALVVWWLVEEQGQPIREDVADSARPAVRIRELPWRDGRAWALTLWLTCNSIVFYTTLAWLAPSYADRGWTLNEAGLLFGLFSITQVAGALIFPTLAERIPRPRLLYAAAVLLTALAIATIGWAPDAATLLVVSVLGITLGATFAMGLALLSSWAPDAAASARLTAMAFSVTYLVSASGPLIAGILLDARDSWPLVYSLLAVACLAQLATVPALRRGVQVR
jgi:CP family cyanate transporter-like MFS transporter